MKQMFLYLLIMLVANDCLLARQHIHQEYISTTKEQVNGQLFTHTYQVVDGLKRQAWAIDGKMVDQAAYDEAILEAEKAERGRERQAAYTALDAQHFAQTQMQTALLKKLIQKSLAQIGDQVKKIEDYSLTPYLAFSQSGLSSQDFALITQNLSEQIQHFLEQEEVATSELHEQLARLEGYEKGIKTLVQDSIAKAIAQCDDTAMLKKLLELVA